MCHILSDTESMLVLEFRNSDFSEIEIIAFSGKAKQHNVCVYPVVDKDFDYKIGEKDTKSGKEILQNGIEIHIPAPHTARSVRIEKKER